MTDPVVLLGTQSNGETLPVQVDAFGRLVAEGLQGPKGEDGAQGPAGGAFPLPPDPYEGAFLGWLNGGLSWIGTPPVPIPENVFGPITDWNPVDNLVTVEGSIPESVGSGVTIFQCNADGTYYTQDANVSAEWTTESDIRWDGAAQDNMSPSLMFDGTTTPMFVTTEGVNGRYIHITFPGAGVPISVSLRVYGTYRTGQTFYVNDQLCTSTGVAHPGTGWQTITGWSGPNIQSFKTNSPKNNALEIGAIAIDSKILLDQSKSLSMRISTIFGNQILGIPNRNSNFIVGKYLAVPEQRVARWVLRGVDPTTDIDLLRNT